MVKGRGTHSLWQNRASQLLHFKAGQITCVVELGNFAMATRRSATYAENR